MEKIPNNETNSRSLINRIEDLTVTLRKDLTLLQEYGNDVLSFSNELKTEHDTAVLSCIPAYHRLCSSTYNLERHGAEDSVDSDEREEIVRKIESFVTLVESKVND